MNSTHNMIGEHFGDWTVIAKSEPKNGKTIWKCKCKCGKTKDVYGCNLLSGKSKGCGCTRDKTARQRMQTHGESHTKLYYVWHTMLRRCEDHNTKSYADYGKRGICVCEEWHKYETFKQWAYLSGYSDGLEINRKDNNGNYEPNNCEWVTKSENMNNTRRTRYYEYKGGRYTVRQLSEMCGYSYKTIQNRLYSGWSVDESITIDPQKGNNQKLRKV